MTGKVISFKSLVASRRRRCGTTDHATFLRPEL